MWTSACMLHIWLCLTYHCVLIYGYMIVFLIRLHVGFHDAFISMYCFMCARYRCSLRSWGSVGSGVQTCSLDALIHKDGLSKTRLMHLVLVCFEVYRLCVIVCSREQTSLGHLAWWFHVDMIVYLVVQCFTTENQRKRL